MLIRKSDEDHEVTDDAFINPMPNLRLIHRLGPPPPPEVRQATRRLSYRDAVVVALTLSRGNAFPGHWIYIHSPDIKVGCIQNLKNGRAALVSEPPRTCLGMEYPCAKGDALWAMQDTELITLASQELVKIGLAEPGDVEGGTVIRQRTAALPIVHEIYRQHLRVLQRYLSRFESLQTAGRTGMQRYK